MEYRVHRLRHLYALHITKKLNKIYAIYSSSFFPKFPLHLSFLWANKNATLQMVLSQLISRKWKCFFLLYSFNVEYKTFINKCRDNDSVGRMQTIFVHQHDKWHKHIHSKHIGTVTYYLCFMYAEKALKFTQTHY